jgi:hypothetical protein
MQRRARFCLRRTWGCLIRLPPPNVRTLALSRRLPGPRISRKPCGYFNFDHSSGQMGEAIPGNVASAVSSGLLALSQVHSFVQVDAPAKQVALSRNATRVLNTMPGLGENVSAKVGL